MITKTSNHDPAIDASPIRKTSPTQQAIDNLALCTRFARHH
ncbi:hypothetical protein [Scytonema hofmannii]|nr:hypothetical protein [Scytonema hofmannii]